MMKNLGSSGSHALGKLRRYHTVVFIVLIVAVLSVAILLLNSIVLKASNSSSEPAGGSQASFDQTTIKRIEGLRTSDNPGQPPDFSAGRISPFSE